MGGRCTGEKGIVRPGVWRERILEGLWGGPQAEARDQEKESQGRWIWDLRDLTVLEAGG